MSFKNKLILKELKKLNKENLITNEQLETISKKYKEDYIDLKPIIKGIMITGIILVAIGFIAFLTFYIFSLYFVSSLFTFLFLSGFIIDEIMKRKHIEMPKTSSAIIALSSIFLAADIFTIFYIITRSKDHFIILSLISIFIFFIIAYVKRNNIVLVMALISFITWYGFEGFDIPEIDNYLLNINTYIRFASLSILIFLIGITNINKKIFNVKYSKFSKLYYITGLIYLNIVLAIMSIFGTYEEIILFSNHKLEIIIYSILFLIINILTLIIGYKLKIYSIIKYSVFFIITNIYIRYFEYFYEEMNTWIFFTILGFFTILIGIIIERIIQNY